ncbi:hypothetical protein B0T40_24060 [Chromobacterium haemolyticum]|uniref:hypothetical protein n=1 Tax=Chromobacterium haemolyticum TaxID=394935 RepID=UPI0009DA946D|nr:hypothetical protein [Chromobacterium haemolyticum]OQS30943.1 hypothetical protein B0T40_24060 [Chromobacterium haemolyticum]
MSNWQSFPLFSGDGTTQAANQAMAVAESQVRLPPVRLDRVTIKRIPLWSKPGMYNYEGEIFKFGPGHYWVEIAHDDPKIKESYGWYPARDIRAMSPPKMLGAMWDVEGCINGDSDERRATDKRRGNLNFEKLAGQGIGSQPFPSDPNHGNPKARSVVHPYFRLYRSDERSVEATIQQIRDFAASYQTQYGGRWSYRLDSFDEDNCHTFIWRLLHDCQLVDAKLLDPNTDIHFEKINGKYPLATAKDALRGLPETCFRQSKTKHALTQIKFSAT